MAIISYQDGLRMASRVVDIPVTHDPHFNSCYLFAFPKSGSVLLNNIAAALMSDAGIPIIDIPTICFQSGIWSDGAVFEFDQIFKPNGYCYSGFRNVLTNMRGIVSQLPGRKMLLVRDPRDMLVSLYYSMKFSHPWPDAGTAQFFAQVNGLRLSSQPIDRFCISNADLYVGWYKSYIELFEAPGVKVLRYEDVIFDKPGLARIMRDWFGLDIEAARLSDLVAPLDVVPTEERPHEHIRQVRPQDYKRKLRPATIEILNAILDEFIRRFGYVQ